MRIGGPAGKTRSRSWWRASFNSAPGHPLLYTLALAPLLTRSVPCVAAGIADTPLPVLQAGATTQFLYSVPGVIQGGNISTFFLCTSTDTASQQVGVEVFPYPGGAPCNDAAAESFSLGPGATVRFGTAQPANDILGFLGLSSTIGCGGGANGGSARILSTSKKLVCTAFAGDRVNIPPQTTWQLTIIAKLKQKAAN